MTCKDCVHFEACKNILLKAFPKTTESEIEAASNAVGGCYLFKPKSRFVELPCEAGQTVYSIRWWDDVKEKCTDSKGKTFYRKTIKHKVTKEKFNPYSIDYKQFGETVFLSREEAENALQRKEDEGK